MATRCGASVIASFLLLAAACGGSTTEPVPDADTPEASTAQVDPASGPSGVQLSSECDSLVKEMVGIRRVWLAELSGLTEADLGGVRDQELFAEYNPQLVELETDANVQSCDGWELAICDHRDAVQPQGEAAEIVYAIFLFVGCADAAAGSGPSTTETEVATTEAAESADPADDAQGGDATDEISFSVLHTTTAPDPNDDRDTDVLVTVQVTNHGSEAFAFPEMTFKDPAGRTSQWGADNDVYVIPGRQGLMNVSLRVATADITPTDLGRLTIRWGSAVEEEGSMQSVSFDLPATGSPADRTLPAALEVGDSFTYADPGLIAHIEGFSTEVDRFNVLFLVITLRWENKSLDTFNCPSFLRPTLVETESTHAHKPPAVGRPALSAILSADPCRGLRTDETSEPIDYEIQIDDGDQAFGKRATSLGMDVYPLNLGRTLVLIGDFGRPHPQCPTLSVSCLIDNGRYLAGDTPVWIPIVADLG